MGQKFTKAIQRAGPPAQAQRVRSAAEAELKRSSAAGGGGGVGDYNPTRGEEHRAQYQGMGESPDVMPEMPTDLIKFLNDAGPLERTIDKELTSDKVYDTLVTDEKARDEQAKQANLRVRRRMPIVSSFGDESQANDGIMTERSTNFSTRDRSAIPMRLGITREDLFRLSDKVNGLKVDSPEWKKFMENEYAAITKNESKSKNFDQLQDKALFENSLKFIGVPVLMKDTEGDIIGVWHSKSEEMKHSNGLKVAPKESVQFNMLSEGSVAKES